MSLALLRACHPEPVVVVTLVAGVLALAVGHPAATALPVTAALAASQLAVGWANDAVDARRDAAVGRSDKPVARGVVPRRVAAVAAAVAAAVTVLLAGWFGPVALAVAVLGLASALTYNWPLKRTVLSPLPYAVSFAALPAFVVLTLPATPPGWMLVAGALLGTGAHFANALPDLVDDLTTGVRGAPHRLGETGSALAAAGLLLAAAVVLAFGPAGPVGAVGLVGFAAALLTLAVGWYARWRATGRGHRRPVALFRAFMLVALVDVGLLLLTPPG